MNIQFLDKPLELDFPFKVENPRLQFNDKLPFWADVEFVIRVDSLVLFRKTYKNNNMEICFRHRPQNDPEMRYAEWVTHDNGWTVHNSGYGPRLTDAAQKKLIEWAAKHGQQIFDTYHNQGLLQNAKAKHMRELRYADDDIERITTVLEHLKRARRNLLKEQVLLENGWTLKRLVFQIVKANGYTFDTLIDRRADDWNRTTSRNIQGWSFEKVGSKIAIYEDNWIDVIRDSSLILPADVKTIWNKLTPMKEAA